MDYSATIEIDTGEVVLFEQTYRDGNDLFNCLERREKLEHWSYQTRGSVEGDGYYDAVFGHTFPNGIVLEIGWTYVLWDREWYCPGMRIGDKSEIWYHFGESSDDARAVSVPSDLCGDYTYRYGGDTYTLRLMEVRK